MLRAAHIVAAVIAGLATIAFLAVASSGQTSTASIPAACDCIAPLAPAGDAGESAGWEYPEMEIPPLSHDYDKLDLFEDGLAGEAICSWPCLHAPEPGTYTVSLSTSQESPVFDLFAFLVSTDVASRTAASALFLDAETAQGKVQFRFEIPGDVDPEEWILVILFDEDLCWFLPPKECACIRYVPFRSNGTVRIIKE